MVEPKSRKVHINISLTQEALDLLGEESARQDRSRSWLIEWAVKKALAPEHSRPTGSPLSSWDLSGMPPVTSGPSSETTATHPAEVQPSQPWPRTVQAEPASATPFTNQQIADLQRIADGPRRYKAFVAQVRPEQEQARTAGVFEPVDEDELPEAK
jgi:hypothetical protein